MSNKSLNKTIGEVWNDEYVVPLYQRNFGWTDTQIGQLLQDIWDHAPKTYDLPLSWFAGSSEAYI